MGRVRALVAHDYGPPAQLRVEDVPQPQPAAGQVLVQIRAAALNPFDVKLLGGAFKDSSPVTFPYVPGMDGAGTVYAVGAGAGGYTAGDEVLGFFGRTPGTIAEYALIQAGDYLTLLPDGLDPVRAAALPQAGITAKTLLRAIQPALAPGRSLLVVGASGGVGMFIVQFAAAYGCEVLATAAPAERDYVLGLGASHALDYTAGDLVEQVLALHPQGVDAIVDLINSGEGVLASARAARDGGVFASTLGGPQELGRGIAASYVSLTLQPGDLEDLAARAALGSLHVEVSRVYALADAAQAYADLAGGSTRGKLVIDVGS
jgi:NADPH:quinone reductase-like Zn-dependent oxidoreductase